LQKYCLDLSIEQLAIKLDFAEELLKIVETLDGEKCRYRRFPINCDDHNAFLAMSTFLAAPLQKRLAVFPSHSRDVTYKLSVAWNNLTAAIIIPGQG
jgi:hypothetical protein